MTIRQKFIHLCSAVVFAIFGSSVSAETELLEQTIVDPAIGEVTLKVPVGYELEVVSTDLQRPRMITFTPDGDMLIGSRSYVYRLKPPFEKIDSYFQVQGYPHSVAVRGDELLIAQTGGLYKTGYDPDARRFATGELQLVARLPGGFGHSSRTLGIGPDGKIYVSIGISGNCSDEYLSDDYRFGNRRGGILLLDETSANSRWMPFASGLRNPVGFDWHPETGIMFAANNGPDHLGFEFPPEYFSKILPGSFHGMPWYQYYDGKLHRDECITSNPPRPKADITIPSVFFPSRSAPLGMAFVPKNAMDKNFELNAVVAIHGSWATLPDGLFTGSQATRRPPAIVMVRFSNGEPVNVEPIVTGFQLEDGRRWARPAGIAAGPDSALYFTSDDGMVEGLMRLKKTK